MYYETVGEGVPFVLITGFCGDTTFFKDLIPELSGEYRVVVFDNRGAGRTEYPEGDITPLNLVGDVVELLDHLGIGRAHVLGWSMGAHIAQELAILRPELVMTLTLVSAYPYRPARSSYFMNGICDCAIDGGDPKYISMMTNAFCFTEEFFEGREASGRPLRSLEGLDPVRSKEQMRALDMFDTRDRLGSIAAPTLSIHGLNDIMVEPWMGDYISDRIPDCRVLRIEGSGHIVRPRLYVEELKRFLKDHERL